MPAQFPVGERGAGEALAVVEGARDGDGGHVAAQGREQAPLRLRDESLRVEHADTETGYPAERMGHRAAGVAAGRHEHGGFHAIPASVTNRDIRRAMTRAATSLNASVGPWNSSRQWRPGSISDVGGSGSRGRPRAARRARLPGLPSRTAGGRGRSRCRSGATAPARPTPRLSVAPGARERTGRRRARALRAAPRSGSPPAPASGGADEPHGQASPAGAAAAVDHPRSRRRQAWKRTRSQSTPAALFERRRHGRRHQPAAVWAVAQGRTGRGRCPTELQPRAPASTAAVLGGVESWARWALGRARPRRRPGPVTAVQGHSR